MSTILGNDRSSSNKNNLVDGFMYMLVSREVNFTISASHIFISSRSGIDDDEDAVASLPLHSLNQVLLSRLLPYFSLPPVAFFLSLPFSTYHFLSLPFSNINSNKNYKIRVFNTCPIILNSRKI